MESIGAYIELHDRMSAPLERINIALRTTINLYETLNSLATRGLTTRDTRITPTHQSITPMVQDYQIKAPKPIELPVNPVVQDYQVNTPKPIELPVNPVVQDYQVEAPKSIDLPVTPVVQNYQVEAPRSIDLPITPIVQDYQVEVPKSIDLPVNPVVQNYQVETPRPIELPVNPVVQDYQVEAPKSIDLPVKTVVQEISIPDPPPVDIPFELQTHEATSQIDELRHQIESSVDAQSGLNSAYERLNKQVGTTYGHIKENTNAQSGFNAKVEQGVNSASKLNSLLSRAAAGLGAFFGLRQIYRFAIDSLESFDTQLGSETQLLTVLANRLDDDYVLSVAADTRLAATEINNLQESIKTITITPEVRTQALQQQFDAITAKAASIQQEGMYGDEVMLSGAAELSTYFTDTKALELMMDTLANYAAGMSLGQELDAQAMTDYATGLGKILVGSYESMTKKGFEFTDAQKAVIEGTASQAQYIEVLGEEYRNMTADMQAATAISQVINESWANMYQTMSDTPHGKIVSLKNAWGDLQEEIGSRLYASVTKLIDIVRSNWPAIEGIIRGLTTGLGLVINVITTLAAGVLKVVSFFTEHWSTIRPIILGIVAALAVYNAALLSHALNMGLVSVATKIWAGAQALLNAILSASPLVWIALMIGIIAAAIAVVCSNIAKTSNVANNGFAVITGGINVVIAGFKNLGLAVGNIAIGMWNSISAICQNIGTAFHNVLSNVQSWWYNLLSTVLNVISGIAAALNKLPFIEFDYSGITEKANEYAKKSTVTLNDKREYASIAEEFSKGMSTFDTFQEGWANSAFNAGATWGNNISDKVSSVFSQGISKLNAASFIPGSGYNESQIPENIADTAGNTERTADSLSITDEDLKYLRDIAERDTVNRFTTAEIKVNMGGVVNNVSNNTDLDGIVSYLASGIQNAMERTAQGVHS